jgi:hypothetical protein
MVLAGTRGQQPSATSNRNEGAIQQSASILRPVPIDGSLTSVQRSFSHPMEELVERSMDLAHDRRFSQVKEELANGCYKPASSDLAECLLKIAERDLQ